MDKIEGYVVGDGRGNLFAKDLIWYSHEWLEAGFVHQKTPAEILELSKNWNVKPAVFFPAVYLETEGTRIKPSGILTTIN